METKYLAGQRPIEGWIYMINPYQVSLRCKMGHIHFYDLIEPGEVECQTASCSLAIDSSHVFRGVGRSRDRLGTARDNCQRDLRSPMATGDGDLCLLDFDGNFDGGASLDSTHI
jgi:hypothetical protein